LGEEYKSFSSSLCNLLHSPVTSSLLGTLPLLPLYAATAVTVTNSPLTIPRSSKWPVSSRLSDQNFIYILLSFI
jgi:hypothetical protein